MAQLYLPVEHTEADLVLAGQIAERIDSAELYVTWTPELGAVAPEVVAELREPLPSWTDTLGLVFQAVRELWSALLNRDYRAQLALPPGAEDPTQRKPAAGEAAA
jgi:hypothetical protein